MGYIAHHAVVATSWKHDELVAAMDEFRKTLASEVEPGVDFSKLLLGPIDGATNGYTSYVLVPDGSKEGWDTSDRGDGVREAFVAICRRLCIDFVEVRFGGDDYDHAQIENHGGD